VAQPDIDIDLADRDQLLALIRHVRATQVQGSQGNQVTKHNTGIYVTDIPRDPINDCAAIDYQTAEQRGYFKIDLLNQSVYRLVRDEAHLQELMSTSPPWHRLWQDRAWCGQLVHVGSYHDLLAQMKPDSITRMAAFISVIRPGKAHLRGMSWPEVFESVWDGDDSRGFVFKKAHAISYAHLVALHMNLLDAPH
jgi:hypothetical protein